MRDKEIVFIDSFCKVFFIVSKEGGFSVPKYVFYKVKKLFCTLYITDNEQSDF